MNKIMAISGVLLLASCAPIGGDAEQREAIATARAVGAPLNCIDRDRIDYTRVRSNQVVDFYMRTGEVYRNTLPDACGDLRFDQRFTYRSTGPQLCSIDTITLVSPGGTPGPVCRLGAFQTIETEAR